MTAGQDKEIRAAIEAIPEAGWTPIPYWLSSPEVSGADVAETSYTAFTGRDAIPVRLIVRRVRPTPGSQLALFTTWDYHAFVTNRRGEMVEVEADHRRHAVVEQRIAELKSAGLAHLPSSSFMANAAWLALTVMAHNIGRAVGRLAGHDLEKATAGTPATADLHRPRPARAQRTSPTPPANPVLAMGGCHRTSSPPDPGHPTALLTAAPYPDPHDLGDAGRPAGPACPDQTNSHHRLDHADRRVIRASSRGSGLRWGNDAALRSSRRWVGGLLGGCGGGLARATVESRGRCSELPRGRGGKRQGR